MPLKLNVGLARKVGEANYGSRGASINLELEVDGSLATEPAKLQDRIRQMFLLVRASLDQELNGNGHAATQAPADGTTRNDNGRSSDRNGGRPRQATQSQVKALHAIAKSQRRDLTEYLHERFRVAGPGELSIQEASQAIDDLKSATSRERR